MELERLIGFCSRKKGTELCIGNKIYEDCDWETEMKKRMDGVSKSVKM